MWSWLSKVDPTVVVTVATTALGWLWHKARGNKRGNTQGIMAGVFQNLMEELLDRYNNEDVTSYMKTARAYIESHMWSVLAKRGVAKNAATQKLAHQALEEATAWLASEVRKARRK